MNEWSFFCSKWLTRRRQNSRWLTSSSWVRVNEFQSDWISLSQSFVQNGWIQDRRIHNGSIIKLSQNEWVKFFFIQNGWLEESRIQDGWHHQVEWEWMSLNQIGLVWVRVLCKMAESTMAVSESNIAEFKMAAIIKLSENEWVKFFCAKWLNPRW